MGQKYYLVAIDDELSDEFMRLFRAHVAKMTEGSGKTPDGFIVEAGTEQCAVCGGEERVAVCLKCDVEYPDREDGT